MKVKYLIELLEKENPEAEVILYNYRNDLCGAIEIFKPFDVEVQEGYEDIVRILGE